MVTPVMYYIIKIRSLKWMVIIIVIMLLSSQLKL